MKVLITVFLASITSFSFAFKALEGGTFQKTTNYSYVKAEVEVACVFEPNDEGEGPMYHYYKDAHAYELSKKYYAKFAEENTCEYDFGNPKNLKVVQIAPYSKKSKVEKEILAQAGGYKKVKVVFWKKESENDINEVLESLLK
jgi:hypothetical protein